MAHRKVVPNQFGKTASLNKASLYANDSEGSDYSDPNTHPKKFMVYTPNINRMVSNR